MIVKICVLTSVHNAFDIRIFHKECKTLAKAGYDVTLIVQHDKDEVVDGIRIASLPRPKNKLERMTRTVWLAYRKAFKINADIYHFHDPELIPIGLLLKLHGKKVIYDVHELVYFDLGDKKWLKYKFALRVIQILYYILEKISVKTFDQLILAEDGYLEYFKAEHGNIDKYLILQNFAVLSIIDGTEPLAAKKSKPILIYAGGLAETRGIRELVKTMGIIKDKAELLLLGAWESKQLEDKCSSYSGWRHCRYLGFVPLREVYGHMKAADIGLAILSPVKNNLTSLLIKTFEYMACARPMVMSNFPIWMEVFSECAVFADPNDPNDIAEKILYLLDHPEEAKRLGKRGRELVETKYNWETESQKLIRFYEELLK